MSEEVFGLSLFKHFDAMATAMDLASHPSDSPESAIQRGKPRNSIFLGAELRFEGEDSRHEVRVRNISAGGMMIDFSVVTPKGTLVKVDVRNLGMISGHVAWSTETRMGIRFDRDIDPEKARLKPVAAPIPGVRKPLSTERRPGLALR
jgi:PilZ domain